MNPFNFEYPSYRPRRIRNNPVLRTMLRETRFTADQLVMPYFVRSGRKVKETISAMPGQYRFSPDSLLFEAESLAASGVRALLLFGLSDAKDDKASGAYAKTGIIPQTIRAVKKRFPDLMVITDVCLCAYTSHGHCGLLNREGKIQNDASLAVLAKMAVAHAEAGADMISPSDMMDGRIQAIRRELDAKGFEELPMMSYAAKYSSSFYGPFREAAHSAPGQVRGISNSPKDRKGYQMDPANREEALREIALDIREGADIVMVKPVLAYLDILREAKNTFQFPLAAYFVSGEYAMIKAAAEKGWLDEKQAVLETLASVFRAGADMVMTYHAKEAAGWMESL
jgi:porphobilinogen synthase